MVTRGCLFLGTCPMTPLLNMYPKASTSMRNLNPSGPVKEQLYMSMVPKKKTYQQDIPVTSQAQSDLGGTQNNQHNYDKVLTSSRKPKVKKKGSDVTLSSTGPDAKELQDVVVGGFCEMLGICVVGQIFSVMIMMNLNILLRMLRVLDHQIHRAEGLSINECEHICQLVIVPNLLCLREIFATGDVLRAYLTMMTVIFFWVAHDSDFFSDKFGVRSIRRVLMSLQQLFTSKLVL